MISAIFKSDSSGTDRMVGYARGEYSSSDSQEKIVETTEDDLAEVFDAASVDTLDGTDESISAAVDGPLTYRDFLVLDDGEISFDAEYVRENEE